MRMTFSDGTRQIFFTDGGDSVDGGDGSDLLFALASATLSGGRGDDTIFGSSGNDMLRGGAGHDNVWGGDGTDTLQGGDGDDTMCGWNGDDALSGGDGDDRLAGYFGNDTIWGGSGNDLVHGWDGDDLLAGGFGADVMMGGEGNDILLSRADAGEPDPAQGGARVLAGIVLGAANDLMEGGPGADLFRFELTVNAKPEIAARHVLNGHIDWAGVVGENANVHDHWVDGIGNDVILDFNRAEGDRIQIVGHTVQAKIVVMEDGGITNSAILLRSNQGANGGAHNGDALGMILVVGVALTDADIAVDPGAIYGAYDQPGAGPYTFDDTGIMPGSPGPSHADHLMA